ncbi:hypothetical protein BpHYR1_052933 [Brachionus plicatilis]|uniref:Uncharacterized protein n=1 Tax=Brachionus plicatilis TaxID=10195 RepID=A0A3M7P4Q0_BRAPC|nr:hypothetical protein BpHYR1_052933 [Brachionus plicatilis]
MFAKTLQIKKFLKNSLFTLKNNNTIFRAEDRIRFETTACVGFPILLFLKNTLVILKSDLKFLIRYTIPYTKSICKWNKEPKFKVPLDDKCHLALINKF